MSKSIQGTDEIIEDYILLESILNPEGLKLEQENRLRHERFTKNKVYRESGNAADDRYIGAIRATYGHSITCNKAQGGEVFDPETGLRDYTPLDSLIKIPEIREAIIADFSQKKQKFAIGGEVEEQGRPIDPELEKGESCHFPLLFLSVLPVYGKR